MASYDAERAELLAAFRVLVSDEVNGNIAARLAEYAINALNPDLGVRYRAEFMAEIWRAFALHRNVFAEHPAHGLTLDVRSADAELNDVHERKLQARNLKKYAEQVQAMRRAAEKVERLAGDLRDRLGVTSLDSFEPGIELPAMLSITLRASEMAASELARRWARLGRPRKDALRILIVQLLTIHERRRGKPRGERNEAETDDMHKLFEMFDESEPSTGMMRETIEVEHRRALLVEWRSVPVNVATAEGLARGQAGGPHHHARTIADVHRLLTAEIDDVLDDVLDDVTSPSPEDLDDALQVFDDVGLPRPTRGIEHQLRTLRAFRHALSACCAAETEDVTEATVERALHRMKDRPFGDPKHWTLTLRCDGSGIWTVMQAGPVSDDE